MLYPATRRRHAAQDATATSPSHTARARSWRWCGTSSAERNEGGRLRHPPRILAVDDVSTNLDILRVRLESQGYEVVTAVDGEDALARTAELQPDLILLDIMMPKMDGIEVVKRLKQDPVHRFIPVILVTAKAETKDVVSGLEAGGDDYLTKPFEHAALMARVRSLLRAKQ